jgi:cell division protein FtsQ
MTAQNNIFSADIKEYRKKRKKNRSIRNLVIFLRFSLIFGISVAVFWWITLPQWVLTGSEQIEIEGNEFLSDDEIRQLIPLKYPQPILTLSGRDLEENLTQQAPLTNIVVTKQILPPSVTIKVTEKEPVALAFGPVVGESGQINIVHIGYINSEGIFVDKGMYQNLQEEKDKLPQLKMIGTPTLYLPYWENLYGLLIQSPMTITEVDWRNPNNIILTTDLGKIHLGAYTSKLPEQLNVLAQLKTITQQIRREDIVYIDLLDPNRPLIKEKNVDG